MQQPTREEEGHIKRLAQGEAEALANWRQLHDERQLWDKRQQRDKRRRGRQERGYA
jgi:hypothetical protein